MTERVTGAEMDALQKRVSDGFPECAECEGVCDDWFVLADDILALDAALTETRERLAKAEEGYCKDHGHDDDSYWWMCPACGQKHRGIPPCPDGLTETRAENQRLREALEEIASAAMLDYGTAVWWFPQRAKQALAEGAAVLPKDGASDE